MARQEIQILKDQFRVWSSFSPTGEMRPLSDGVAPPAASTKGSAMKEWVTVLRAADAAARWHVQQRRKALPRSRTSIEVADLVGEATDGKDPDLVIAALLHDAVEDLQVPLDLIAREFGSKVAALVAEVTDDKTLEKAERKRRQVETARKKSDQAKMLKLADQQSTRHRVQSAAGLAGEAPARIHRLGEKRCCRIEGSVPLAGAAVRSRRARCRTFSGGGRGASAVGEGMVSRYRVLVDDNFHYMDEDERYELGVFATADEAIAACKRIVDEHLACAFEPGMTAQELYDACTSFGEDPFVCPVADAEAVKFSAWDYAKQRCCALTSRGGDKTD
jgi:guanosine-3',5'-bis(diphosphate) 3'-pyrophosphohydrolase